MLNGERSIPRPLRWAMIGGGRLSQWATSTVPAHCATTPPIGWLPALLISTRRADVSLASISACPPNAAMTTINSCWRKKPTAKMALRW